MARKKCPQCECHVTYVATFGLENSVLIMLKWWALPPLSHWGTRGVGRCAVLCSAIPGNMGLDVEMLIELVHNSPPLWNKSDPEFCNNTLRRELWDGIAKDLGETAARVSIKWKGLRGGFCERKIALQGVTGQAAKKIKRWKWYRSLEWLSNHISIRE